MVENDFAAVTSIDFGTYASGFSIAMKGAGTVSVEDAAINVFAPGDSTSSGGVHKALSAILLKADTEDVVAIGARARKLFAASCDDGKQAQYLYFEHFKMGMSPQTRKVKPNAVMIKASGANVEKPLMLPVSKYLSVIKKEASARLAVLDEVTRGDIPPAKIGWVITVPAIWDDEAKMFMREAAVKAGIVDAVDSRRLVLALEPEGAIISSMLSSVPEVRPLFVRGSRLMVLDCGGGTVDITVSEVKTADPISAVEILPASGGAWGGTYVDRAYLQMLATLMGADAFGALDHGMKVELLDSWEVTKRKFNPTDAHHENNVDLSAAMDVLKDMGPTYRDIKDRVHRNLVTVNEARGLRGPGEQMEMTSSGVLKISAACMRGLFDAVIDLTLAHVRTLLDKPVLRDQPLNFLLLVGGFAESPYLQQRVREAFAGRLRVVTPPRPELLVVRGAAQFGLYPTTFITRRKTRYTYAITVSNPWDDRKHAGYEVLRYRPEGRDVDYCNKILLKLVGIGKDVGVNEVITREGLCVVSPTQRVVTVKLYRLSEDLPASEDAVRPRVVQPTGGTIPDAIPASAKLGELTVTVADSDATPENERTVNVHLYFGHTELLFEAVAPRTGDRKSSNFALAR